METEVAVASEEMVVMAAAAMMVAVMAPVGVARVVAREASSTRILRSHQVQSQLHTACSATGTTT